MTRAKTKRREGTTPTEKDILTRWGGHKIILKEGFLAVPTVFLKHLAELGPYGLNPTEALFLLELMVFKWDKDAPFPSYKTLAKRMGISEVYIRKLARTLEEKKFLQRVGRTGTTNQFDLEPFFKIIEEHTKRIAANTEEKEG